MCALQMPHLIIYMVAKRISCHKQLILRILYTVVTAFVCLLLSGIEKLRLCDTTYAFGYA